MQSAGKVRSERCLDIVCISTPTPEAQRSFKYTAVCITKAKDYAYVKAKDHGHWVRDRVQAVRSHTPKSSKGDLFAMRGVMIK